MKNILIIFILNLTFVHPIMAAQTNPINLNGLLPSTVTVTTSGGNINTIIDSSTGALGGAFNPSFEMRSNDPTQKNLTVKITANTNTGYQNAVFDIGTTKYIIMTNSNYPPNISSLNDIKTGALANNPNAIAYIANDPSDDTGNVSISYNNSNKYWDLRLTNNKSGKTTFTVPAGTPLNNSYTYDDEAGDYKAIVTLSFTCY